MNKYDDSIKHNRINKADNETTSEQAEILFIGNIPSKYILNIYDYKRT